MDGLFAISDAVQIKGSHYDAAGNATKVNCNTKLGHFITILVGGAFPPRLDVQLISFNPACAPLEAMTDQFASFGPSSDELQVVKNGVAKRECVFHGVLPYSDPEEASYWAANTVRKFDSAGNPTTEKGSFTLNTPDGQMFIGKVKMHYGFVSP